MKRNILAVIIPALLIAGTANTAEIYNKDGNKVDLYGRAVGLHYLSKGNGESSCGSNGDMTYVCFGLKGEIQINSDLIGYGQWEYNFQGNNSEGADTQTGNKMCLTPADLKCVGVGSFDYGRNYGVVYGALGYTDILPEFGGDTAYSDDFSVGRVGGVATYHSSNFFDLVNGLNFAVQCLGRGECDAVCRSNGDGVGSSVSYEYGGSGIAGTYDATDRTNLQEESPPGKDKKAEQWATGLKYDVNNIYLVTNHGEIRNTAPTTNKFANTSGFASKTQDVLLAVQYQSDPDLCPSIACIESKMKNAEDTGDVDLVSYFEVGVTYYSNKNMSIYVGYIINRIDSDSKLGIGSDDTTAVGTVYQF